MNMLSVYETDFDVKYAGEGLLVISDFVFAFKNILNFLLYFQ